MKRIAIGFLFLSSLFVCSSSFAKTNLHEKYREPDLRLSAYKVDNNYYGSLSGTVNVDENISIDATIETNGYLEIGTAYGDVIFNNIYAEGYVSYGRSDTTDIYTLGIFAGASVY